SLPRSGRAGNLGQTIGQRDPINVRLIVRVALGLTIQRLYEQRPGNMQFPGPALGFEEHRAAAATAEASRAAFAGNIPLQQGFSILDIDRQSFAPNPSDERGAMRTLTAGAVAMRNPLGRQ